MVGSSIRLSMRILNALLLSIRTLHVDQIDLQKVEDLYYNFDSFILETDHYRQVFFLTFENCL